MVKVGLEQLMDSKNNPLEGRRVGLLAHGASVDSNLNHTLTRFQQSGINVSVLFGPEHGFFADAQDMISVTNTSKAPGRLPVVSLYGDDPDTLSPPKTMLSGLDTVVVDLADVGSRYYTYVWTAVLTLRACYQAGVELILLDRPNPLGGEIIEGAPGLPDFSSFVGLCPLPNRHGLTIGEILNKVAIEEGLDAGLKIIKMAGWQRKMWFDNTGLPWVLPSPNMPTLDTATVYPGSCLIEGTWASEGRGTTRPFETIGAPTINSHQLARTLQAMNLPGVCFRPTTFCPTFHKHAKTAVQGVQIHVLNRDVFLPYRTGVALLIALKATAGQSFKWRTQPYEFVRDRPAIDLLTGSDQIRIGIHNGASLEELIATWQDGEKAFFKQREPFLLY